MPRYLVLVEIDANSPLEAEQLVGKQLSHKGAPYVRQTYIQVLKE